MTRKIILILIIVAVSFQFMVPIQGYAITLGEYEAKLDQYKKEASDNKAAINMTEGEMKNANAQIDNLKSEMNKLLDEVKALNSEIDDYNNQIKDKLLQSQQLVEYMQLSTGENVYLEYVFKADSTSDLIYRVALVKELVDYNNRSIEEMKQIISDNKNRETEIEKRKVEIESKEEALKGKLVQLGEKKESLDNMGVTVSQQIKIYEELVASYKKLGCKSSDVIGVDCAVSGDAGVFRRPTKSGYITQEAYYKPSYTHRAVDVGSRNGSGERIYPVANGRIVAKYIDIYGALCIAVEHYNSVDGKWYTSLYAHLSSYAPNLKVGDYVTSDQYLGYMGNTGYSFGIHLHLEVFPCRLNNLGDANCSNLSKFISYGTNLLKNGYKGPRALINFPSGTYNSWNSR